MFYDCHYYNGKRLDINWVFIYVSDVNLVCSGKSIILEIFIVFNQSASTRCG